MTRSKRNNKKIKGGFSFWGSTSTQQTEQPTAKPESRGFMSGWYDSLFGTKKEEPTTESLAVQSNDPFASSSTTPLTPSSTNGQKGGKKYKDKKTRKTRKIHK